MVMIVCSINLNTFDSLKVIRGSWNAFVHRIRQMLCVCALEFLYVLLCVCVYKHTHAQTHCTSLTIIFLNTNETENNLTRFPSKIFSHLS